MADYSGDLKYRITVDGAEASQAKAFRARSFVQECRFDRRIKCCSDGVLPESNRVCWRWQYQTTRMRSKRHASLTQPWSPPAEQQNSPRKNSDMASELQALSNFGDEDILQGVTLQLLRFDAIGRDIFPRAQQLVIDLAESMGGVENAARTLGISLADPTLGLTRLRRIGVAFNSQQEEQIKNFVETGKVAEAQAVLMSALEERFGGLALASVSATTQMKNAWGDYLEGVGSSLSFFLMESNAALLQCWSV